MAGSSKIWAGLSSATELAKKSDIPPIVNNLTSTSITSALSAAQGKTLKEAIDSIGNSEQQLKMKVAAGTVSTGSSTATLDVGATIGAIIYTVNIRITNSAYYTKYSIADSSGTFIAANEAVFPEVGFFYNSWSIRDVEWQHMSEVSGSKLKITVGCVTSASATIILPWIPYILFYYE